MEDILLARIGKLNLAQTKVQWKPSCYADDGVK